MCNIVTDILRLVFAHLHICLRLLIILSEAVAKAAKNFDKLSGRRDVGSIN